MEVLKQNIKTILANHPGARKREIAHDLRIWHCNSDFLKAMNELEKSGKIKSKYYSDPANMEFYDEWFLA